MDGLSAADIASALGYKNIKTNTFSARLSAARQFGLLSLTGDGYALTPLAREILHPVDPSGLGRLHRQALLKPPLYAELAERLAGKRVPDAEILGNVLYHNHQIIASAKRQAAEAFLESARFAGALGDDQVFRPEGPPGPVAKPEAAAPLAAPSPHGPGRRAPARPRCGSTCGSGTATRARRSASAPRSRSPPPASSGSSRRSGSWCGSRIGWGVGGGEWGDQDSDSTPHSPPPTRAAPLKILSGSGCRLSWESAGRRSAPVPPGRPPGLVVASPGGHRPSGGDRVVMHVSTEVGPARGPSATAAPRWAMATFVVLFAMNLLDYLDRNVLMADAAAGQGASCTISNAQWGLLTSIFLVSYSVFSPVMGWLGDRYRRTWLLGAGGRASGAWRRSAAAWRGATATWRWRGASSGSARRPTA